MPVRSLATLAFIVLVKQNNIFAPEVQISMNIKPTPTSRTISRRCRQLARGKILWFRFESEAEFVRNVALKRGLPAGSIFQSVEFTRKGSFIERSPKRRGLKKTAGRRSFRKPLFCFVIDG